VVYTIRRESEREGGEKKKGKNASITRGSYITFKSLERLIIIVIIISRRNREEKKTRIR